MPITLWTGLPGNGKTLNALKAVKMQSEKEARPVFYSGIKITDPAALPWTEIEPEKWFEVPNGSIVVIDECQRVFRPRMHGKEPPQHVVELETHRHKGIDIHLITQHPMLADPSIRRLTDRHLHVVRAFGTESCTIHEWPQVRENCEKPAGRQDSIKHLTKYPKEVYAWYKSAEVHTMKRRVPAKFFVLAAAPVVLFGLVYYLYGNIMARIDGTHESSKPSFMQGQQASPGALPGAPSGYFGTPAGGRGEKADYRHAEEDAKQYMYERTPRMQGIAYTAPIYDDLTKPSRVPVPAACVQSGKRCQCYTQQATKLDVPFNQCAELAHNGYFQEFDANGRGGDQDRRAHNQKVLEQQDRLPISGARTKDRAPGAAADLSTGWGLLGSRRDGVRQRVVDDASSRPEG